ncbi:MAG: LPS-assembly protein LptD, partial [Comamonadaceae bacterium]
MPDLTRAARRRCLPPLPLALLSLALLHAHGAAAQGVDDAPLTLKRTPQLQETVPKLSRGEQSSFITGDAITGRPDLETVVTGNAQLRRGDTVINADRLEYDQPSDTARATGNVRVNQAGNVYEGPDLQLKVESFEGFFNNVRYRFLATGGHGDAQRIDFVDEARSVARQATYTTCRREDLPGWMPAWMLSASQLNTDTEENVGVARNAQLTFMGLSTPPFPSLSFPLDNTRKSGFLPPTIGVDNTNGIEITQPYYWNIAPNRDATFTPTLMSKRGVNLSTDFRYLEQGYSGEVRFDYMPSDTLRKRDRWGVWGTHSQ